MCGIIGYSGKGDAVRMLVEGLFTLEYRGYDSSGIAVFDGNEIVCIKSKGRIEALEKKIEEIRPKNASCGIGHTRWATHGAPSDINAHPHTVGRVCGVHNGIIENYAALRDALLPLGYSFKSETDTEVAVAVIDKYYAETGDALRALACAARQFEGSYAMGVMFSGAPGKIFSISKRSPLIAAEGLGESYIASDITALLGHTESYVRVSDGEIAELCDGKISFYDFDGNVVKKTPEKILWGRDAAEKMGFEHFMRKEIEESPAAIKATVSSVKRAIEESPAVLERLASAGNIHIVACGTAMHAGLIGKRIIEQVCRIPVSVHIASEFRYSPPILHPSDVFIAISQSGETADTLAAISLAKEVGMYVLSVVNVVGSNVARESDSVLYTCAGPEVAVASTKAYQVQMAALYVLAAKLASFMGRAENDFCNGIAEELPTDACDALRKMIARENELISVSERIMSSENLFFIGRGVDCDLCAEASLKLKEVSYIHSEAYAAGELKHGTISLITKGTPVIAFATQKNVYDKMSSNIAEVASRGADVILICGEDFPISDDAGYTVIRLPQVRDVFTPFVCAGAFQLIAYHTAVLRGCDVDKPRNLAKSVTVE